MNFYKPLIVLLSALTIGMSLHAQPGTQPAKQVPKFKPPVITTMLGKYTDSATVSPEEAKDLIRKPLVFSDAKKTEYKVSTYMLVYRRLVVSETNDGKAYLSKSMTGKLMRETPLPKIWIDNLETELKKGEELFFTDIIVEGKNGMVYYAKNLKLKIE